MTFCDTAWEAGQELRSHMYAVVCPILKCALSKYIRIYVLYHIITDSKEAIQSLWKSKMAEYDLYYSWPVWGTCNVFLQNIGWISFDTLIACCAINFSPSQPALWLFTSFQLKYDQTQATSRVKRGVWRCYLYGLIIACSSCAMLCHRPKSMEPHQNSTSCNHPVTVAYVREEEEKGKQR